MISGKPVFEEPSVGSAPPPQSPAPNSVQANGPKYIPQVIIEHVKCELEGTNMTCSLVIKNLSTVEVFLDKVRLVNTTKELDATLRAGESKEFYATYRGPQPTSASYSDCQLEYRDTTGDYFRSSHVAEYNYESTGTYSLKKLRFVGPVRDI